MVRLRETKIQNIKNVFALYDEFNLVDE